MSAKSRNENLKEENDGINLEIVIAELDGQRHDIIRKPGDYL